MENKNNSYPITQKGLDILLNELKEYKEVKKPNIISKVAEARELGDLKENSEYHASRDEYSFIEGYIGYLEGIQAIANIINPKENNSDSVSFGSMVKIKNLINDSEREVEILSEYETKHIKNSISNTSPIGIALIGKKVNDCVSVTLPIGEVEYQIIKINNL
jgi:transcription elongation factor GreA